MEAGKRTIESSAGQVTSGKIGGAFAKTAAPAFVPPRAALFETLFAAQEARYAEAAHPAISVTLPDGKTVQAKAFETTPLDIAAGISKGLAEAVVGAKIVYRTRLPNPVCDSLVDADEDGPAHGAEQTLFDLSHKLEGDCELTLLKFDSKEGKTMFWHSSAHLLGQALENAFGAYLTHGPPLENGFFYDCYMGEHAVRPEHYAEIEAGIDGIIEQNQPFQRLIITKEQALDMFQHNPFKVAFIRAKIPDGAATTVYRCGTLVDLCTGPHLPSTGRVKAVKVTNASSSYWLASALNDSLQRVYGVSFPSKKELADHLKLQEELEKRKHTVVGEQQRLFTFTKYAPGCPNFLPHGTRIYNRLVALVRREYVARGFSEVKSSLMNSDQLWMTSGHYFKYKDDMYFLKQDEDQAVGLKPMNCPVHCSVFDLHQKSYRDLPIRMADFGGLHRNEITGALTGLTRVRQFHQDDAHIFCTEDQMLSEIKSCLDFLKHLYDVLGFSYNLELSTRPAMRVGGDDVWDKAEAILRQALLDNRKDFKVAEGEGAFYGPKIDIKVSDCLQRVHQLGTIQLDFNLPERFNLQYRAPDDAAEDKQLSLTDAEVEAKIAQIKKDDNKMEVLKQFKLRASQGEDVTLEQIEAEFKTPQYTVSGKLKPGFRRPIMIHRAIFGSLERCIAILCEHFGGKWPFWLSPRQAIVIPVSEKFEAYARKVQQRLVVEGFYADLDDSNAGINKKVRSAQLEQFNYILVVGEKEEGSHTATLRERDHEKPKGVFGIDEIVALFKGQEPPESAAWQELRAKTVFGPEARPDETLEARLTALDQRLVSRVYLSGDGLGFGDEDRSQMELLKDEAICPKKFPHLARWRNFVLATQSA